MALHQAITQPFLQKPVHAPFFDQGVIVTHAVVAGITHSATPTAGNDLPDLGIVVDANLDVGRGKVASGILEKVSKVERGGKLAALRDTQVQVEYTFHA